MPRFVHALAEQAMPRLLAADARAWTARLDPEVETFRAVVQRAIVSGEAAAVREGLRLVGALWWFSRQRGYLTEAREWADEAVRIGRDLPDDTLAALALGGARAG